VTVVLPEHERRGTVPATSFIDGVFTTEAGGAQALLTTSATDRYTYTIVKTADATHLYL
jgi:hypothetical protein